MGQLTVHINGTRPGLLRPALEEHAKEIRAAIAKAFALPPKYFGIDGAVREEGTPRPPYRRQGINEPSTEWKMTKPKNKAEALQREVEELKTLKDFQAANIRTLSELVQRTERDSQGHKESATAFRLKSESLEAELASVRRILSEKNKAFDERNGEAGRAEEVARTLAAKINDVADILAKIASGEGFYGTMALVQKAAAEALAALAQRGSYTEHLPF